MTISAASRIVPEYPLGSAAEAHDGKHAILHIVQYNAFKGNQTPARAADWIIGQAPDIVTLEENEQGPDGIAARLSAYYPYQVSCVPDMRCSTVILSRTRPVAAGGLAQGDPENRKAPSVAWARFMANGGAFTVVAAHLQRPWPLGDQVPAQRAIAQFVAGGDRRRTIIAGDFNLTPWAFAMDRQDRLFSIRRLTSSLPTWPVPMPVLPIDHVYAGGGWQLTRIERGPATGSDHYPLSVLLSSVR